MVNNFFQVHLGRVNTVEWPKTATNWQRAPFAFLAPSSAREEGAMLAALAWPFILILLALSWQPLLQQFRFPS